MESIDFMDTKRRRRHIIMLLVGYVLIGVALLLITVILVFIAYGFNYKNGRVIQNGLVYVSSTPNPAQLYIDGARYTSSTNTRLLLPAGSYSFRLARTGYRSWQRSIVVGGGQIMYYQYPFLIPNQLVTTTVREYTATPSLFTESP